MGKSLEGMIICTTFAFAALEKMILRSAAFSLFEMIS